MPSVWGMSAPWRTLPRGMTSSSRPPMAHQSRRASSSSLSDCESQSARFRTPQPPVENDGGDLPALAAAGAVAQHPAAPEADRLGQHFVLGGGIVAVFVVALAVYALHRLPAGADAVEGGEVALVRLAGEDDALELGVGEPALGNHALGQHGPVGRHGVRHRRHGARLHQRRRVGDGTRNMDGARPPGLVGAGGLRGRLAAVLAGVGCCRHGLAGELGDGPPIVRRRLRLRRGGAGTPGRCGPGRGRMAEQIGARHGLDREARRHGGGDGLEQVGGVAHAGAGIDLALLLAAAVEHGEAGVEGGAAAGVDAAVDRGGEHRPGRRVEGREGVCPRRVAWGAMRRRNRHQPPARRKHRDGGVDVAQVGVVTDAVDAGACREGRVHQDHGGAELWQMIPDRLGVVAADGGAEEQAGQQSGAGGGDLVEVQCAPGPVAEGALGHHRQHAGACRGFENDVAGPDRGGLQRGIGQGQRRRELLQPQLLIGAPRLGGLQRRQRLQHAEHGGRAVRSRPGLAPHGAAVALDEQHQRSLRRLVGVLPDPGTVSVGRAEGGGHRLAQRAGIEGAAGFEDRQQGAGSGKQCGRLRGGGGSRRGGAGDGGCGDGGGRARGRGRRRMGVEHGAGSGYRGVRKAAMARCGAVAPSPVRSASPESRDPWLLAADRAGAVRPQRRSAAGIRDAGGDALGERGLGRGSPENPGGIGHAARR